MATKISEVHSRGNAEQTALAEAPSSPELEAEQTSSGEALPKPKLDAEQNPLVDVALFKEHFGSVSNQYAQQPQLPAETKSRSGLNKYFARVFKEPRASGNPRPERARARAPSERFGPSERNACPRVPAPRHGPSACPRPERALSDQASGNPRP